MNKVILMGRLVRDPEMRTTASQVPMCQFTLAVDRRFKSAGGERQTDFIRCIAWRQNAEFCAKYFTQGSRMAIVGSIQTGSYEKDGQKVYTTDVIVDEAYFADSKRGEGANADYQGGSQAAYASGAKRPSYDERPAQTQTQSTDVYRDAFVPAPDDSTILPFEL